MVSLRIYSLLLVALFLVKCSSDSSPQPAVPPPVDGVRLLVENTGELVSSSLERLEVDALGLNDMAQRACDPGVTPSEVITLGDLKQAWSNLTRSYHYFYVLGHAYLQDEPEAKMLSRVYSWPGSSPAEVAVVKTMGRSRKKLKAKKIESRQDSERGLAVVEYLLFGYSEDWHNLFGAAKWKTQFSKYEGDATVIQSGDVLCPELPTVVEDIVVTIQNVKELIMEREIAPLAEQQSNKWYHEKVSLIASGLQLFENQFYEVQLAVPLNRLPDTHKKKAEQACPVARDCLSKIEHKMSRQPELSMKAQLQFLVDLFSRQSQGSKEAYTMTTYLHHVEKGTEAESFSDRVEKTRSLLEILSESNGGLYGHFVAFKEGSCSANSLCEFFEKSKELAYWLKTEFLVILSSELPVHVKGDGD